MKICSKTHEIAPFKKKFAEKHMPPNTPSKRLAIRHASQAASQHMQLAQPSKKVGPLLTNPAYAHGLLLKNLFEEMRS